MSAINRFDLRRIVKQFGVNAYIETGVGLGASLGYAAEFIDDVIGCEGNAEVYRRFLARAGTEGLHASVTQDVPATFLMELHDLEVGLRPLVFLDAHRSKGTDFSQFRSPQAQPAVPAQEFPLFEQLEVLATKCWVGEAMIVIDDARLYQDLDCFGGPVPEAIRLPPAMRRQLGALLEQFADTHRLDVLPHDEGYLVLLPWAWGVGASELTLVRRGDRYNRAALLPGVAGATSISMMRRVHDARFATRYFVGHGVDIGGGKDALDKFRFAFPLVKSVVNYEHKGWDAQICDNIADNEFDFLYSSHCLEHLGDPELAFHHWLRVVRPGGWLVIDVPDEDLYEQGVFPSRFNPGHQHSFTVAKPASWSSRSISVLDFLRAFRQECEVFSVQRLDHVAHSAMLNKGLDLTQTPFGEAGIEFIVRKVQPAPVQPSGRRKAPLAASAPVAAPGLPS